MKCTLCKNKVLVDDMDRVDGAIYHKACRTNFVTVASTTPIARPSPISRLANEDRSIVTKITQGVRGFMKCSECSSDKLAPLDNYQYGHPNSAVQCKICNNIMYKR
jgi:ribosomal protein S27E